MPHLLQQLNKKGLLSHGRPQYIIDSLHYLVIMGSYAYGVNTDKSDMDVYGFCIPHKDTIFPHLKGVIPGFDKNVQGFDQYQQHHILDKDKDRNYDLTVYNIIKYFRLTMDNNPNMIDSLFVPQRCVLVCTRIGDIVRENRKEFLHKGSWHKFKGYAYSQVHKMKIKNPEGKRKAMVEQYGYDVKFAYHVVRLLNEVEQILTERDLTLDRNREQLKDIRRGYWSQEDIEEYFERKEKELETVYTNSKIPDKPNQEKIKQILLDCLEEHFGTLDGAIQSADKNQVAIEEIKQVLSRRGLL